MHKIKKKNNNNEDKHKRRKNNSLIAISLFHEKKELQKQAYASLFITAVKFQIIHSLDKLKSNN